MMRGYFLFRILILMIYYPSVMSAVDDYCVPKCLIEWRKLTDVHFLSQNDIPLKTVSYSLDVGVPANNCTHIRQCYLNTSEILEVYSFDDEPVVAFFDIRCYHPMVVQMTPYTGKQMTNVMSYIQLITCQLTKEAFNIFGNMVLPFSLVMRDTKIPTNYTLINETVISDTICKMMNQVTTLWIHNNPGESEDKLNFDDLVNIFECGHDFPDMRDLTIHNIRLNTSVFNISAIFPNIVSLEITLAGLTEPIRFPWSETSTLLSHNLSSSEYMLTHYAKANHITVEKNHLRRLLNLGMNEIASLQNYEMDGKLQMVQLSGNGLYEINENLFRKLEDLEHIDLSSNKLQRIPSLAFRGLTLLKHIDVHSNNLTNIQRDILLDNKKVVYIDFSKNNIETIGTDVFKMLEDLRELHLEHNRIISVETLEWPVHSTQLQLLYFDGNPLTYLPEFIFYLRALKRASFKYTNIYFKNFTGYVHNLHYSLIAEKLLKGSVAKNDISIEIVIKNPRAILDNIEDRIRIIDLTGSKINNLHLEYYGTKKEIINRSPLMRIKLLFILKYFKIILGKNPLRCDCGIIQLNRFVAQQKHSNESLLDGKEYFFNDWKCSAPREFKGQSMLSIKEANTYCEKNISNCPRNCSCYERSITFITIIDCRNRHYMSLPEILPNGILELWFQGNNISTLTDNTLNYIPRIRQLLLSENQIVSISDAIVSKMNILSLLHLDSNYLVSLPRALEHMQLTSIKFINNPLKCDCHTKWIKHWMLKNKAVIEGVVDVTCNVDDEEEKGKIFISVPDEDFVCLEDFDSVKHVVIPTVTCSLVLLVLIITLCLMYAYRLEVKVLMYIYLGIHPFDKDDKDGKEIIDVLVLHAPEMTDWVMENVVKYLEFQKDYFVVCEMMRDFVAGFTYLENIASIVKHSKRMLIILSPEFIEDDLLKVAWNEAQEKIKELRTNYAIVVCHEVTLKQVLIKDMQRYIKRGRYIDATQALFHEKLLYSMPQYKDTSDKTKSLPDIKYFIQETYGEENIDNDLYNRHCFISYADSEMPYIMNELRPTLENNGYLLCLPDRDFVPGASKEENVLKAIDSSLHTLFILSGNHLEDEWSVFTFRIASEKSLRVRSNHLIVIIGEDADLETMDDEVQFYIKTHVTLRINEKWFVKKLLNSLPDVGTQLPNIIDHVGNEVQPQRQQRIGEPRTVVAEINHRIENGRANMENGNEENGTIKFVNDAYINDEDIHIELRDELN